LPRAVGQALVDALFDLFADIRGNCLAVNYAGAHEFAESPVQKRAAIFACATTPDKRGEGILVYFRRFGR